MFLSHQNIKRLISLNHVPIHEIWYKKHQMSLTCSVELANIDSEARRNLYTLNNEDTF